jgi:tetratricopeptide (TPR) repeat protein
MLASGSPATARQTIDNPSLAYVEARAAAMGGDHGRSAELLGALAQLQPQDTDLGRKALIEALGAGNIPLALRLVRAVPADKLPTEARLLVAAEEIKARRAERALPWLAVKGDTGDLTFLSPLITAWSAVERGSLAEALQVIDGIPANSLLGPLRAEQRALILLKGKRTAEAEAFARKAIGEAGPRETRLRLALADGFLAAGDRARALIMVEGMSGDAEAARRLVQSGRPTGQAIDTLAKAYAEALATFAADVARMQRGTPPIGLVQVARYTNPESSSTALLLALLLHSRDRSTEALTLLRTFPADDALVSHIRDTQSKIFTDTKRFNEAYAIAAPAAAVPTATAADYSRLGELFGEMKRHSQAADAYGRAVALARASSGDRDLWSLLLLRADALEQAGRWPEARQSLEQALALAPEQPLLLNFLGYGKLERGEDIDAAEAMIRKASELAPDNASIIDSLGWAQVKRGKLAEAIPTLQLAAQKDPGQAEIHEHLGDALFKSGRRFEARFAWEAALVTAEDDIAARVKAKLASGLTSANAAP